MQLRKSVTVPTRFEDEVHIAPQNRNGTKPPYPMLLKAQIVPFNPNNPSAAFPSLPLTSVTAPAVRNAEGSEELPGDSETLNSLSSGGLRVSFVDSTSDGEDNTQAQRQTSEAITTQQNMAIPVEFMIYEPSGAEASTTSSETKYNITWSFLPLSLQYHIYKALAAEYSSSLVPKLLGLTEHEATQIQKAVGLRILHPASVAEIWDYCSKASVQTPGIPQSHSSMDANVFNEYAGYMVFASNYEVAFESEVHHAENFLSSRGIATELLGAWLPDPLDAQFGGLLRHVPGTTGKPKFSNKNLHTDSGYSSFSEAEQDQEVQRNRSRPWSGRNLMKQKASGKRSTIHSAPSSSIYSTKPRSSIERPLIDLAPNLVVRTAPHPLATVTKVGELSSPPRSPRSNAQAPEERIQSSVPQPNSHSIKVSFNNSASLQAQSPQFEPQDHWLMGALDPPASSSPKDTLATILSKAEEHFWNLEREEASQQLASRLSEDSSTAASAPNPQRLVLKIQNKDGLARIWRKKPVPMNWAKKIHPSNSADITEAYLNGPPGSSEHSSFIPLPFNTNMSGLGRGIVVKDAERLLSDGTSENTFVGTPACPPIKPRPCRLESAPVAPNNTKRKASRSDIRLDTSKVQRILAPVAPVAPFNAIVQGNGGDINNLRTETKRCSALSTANVVPLSETTTPTKANHMISSIEPAEEMAGMIVNAASLDTTKSRSPPSPSYSPISENEDLEEFQARLLGPMIRRSCVKVSDHEDNSSSKSNLALVPSSLSNVDFQPPPRLATHAPDDNDIQNRSSLENNDTTNSKGAKPKLNFEEQSKEPSISRNAGSCLPSEQIQESSQRVVTDMARGQAAVRADREMKAPSGTTAQEPPDMATLQKGTTQGTTVTKNKPGGQKGPRGPYRKTRERLAKLAEEKANARTAKPPKTTSTDSDRQSMPN